MLLHGGSFFQWKLLQRSVPHRVRSSWWIMMVGGASDKKQYPAQSSHEFKEKRTCWCCKAPNRLNAQTKGEQWNHVKSTKSTLKIMKHYFEPKQSCSLGTSPHGRRSWPSWLKLKDIKAIPGLQIGKMMRWRAMCHFCAVRSSRSGRPHRELVQGATLIISQASATTRLATPSRPRSRRRLPFACFP